MFDNINVALSMFIKLTNRKQMIVCRNVKVSIVYYIFIESNTSKINSAM